LAVDGRRKLILQGVVSQIETATGANYFYDYATNTVSLSKETIEELTQKTNDVAIRIQDGAEATVWKVGDVTAKLDIEVRILVKAKPDSLVVALQNVIADMSLVLGAAPSLGGICTFTRIDSIEKPFYEISQRFAVAIIHLRAEYDYQPGVDT